MPGRALRPVRGCRGGGRNPPRAVDSSQPKLPLVLYLSITCEAKRIGETDAYGSYVEKV